VAVGRPRCYRCGMLAPVAPLALSVAAAPARLVFRPRFEDFRPILAGEWIAADARNRSARRTFSLRRSLRDKG